MKPDASQTELTSVWEASFGPVPYGEPTVKTLPKLTSTAQRKKEPDGSNKKNQAPTNREDSQLEKPEKSALGAAVRGTTLTSISVL